MATYPTHEPRRGLPAREKHYVEACSLKTGGTGIRYTVVVEGRSTYLFYEGPRWFVEAKVVGMP